MIRDVLTVMWKEWRDLPFLQGVPRGRFALGPKWGSGLGGIISQLLLALLVGVLMPRDMGERYLTSGMMLGFSVWAPFVLTIGLSADAFAGERERKTLETLLASRLSDRAILFGKMATLISYTWVMSLLIMLLALVTVNLQAGHGKLLMYPAVIAIGAPVIALLSAGLLTGLGVIVSLRASTVRQATQTISYVCFAMFLLPIFAKMLPGEWASQAFEWMGRAGMVGKVGVFVVVFIVLDVVVVAIATARFRRSRLILD